MGRGSVEAGRAAGRRAPWQLSVVPVGGDLAGGVSSGVAAARGRRCTARLPALRSLRSRLWARYFRRPSGQGAAVALSSAFQSRLRARARAPARALGSSPSTAGMRVLRGIFFSGGGGSTPNRTCSKCRSGESIRAAVCLSASRASVGGGDARASHAPPVWSFENGDEKAAAGGARGEECERGGRRGAGNDEGRSEPNVRGRRDPPRISSRRRACLYRAPRALRLWDFCHFSSWARLTKRRAASRRQPRLPAPAPFHRTPRALRRAHARR